MTIPTVELIFDRDCPNVADARAQLRRALEQANMPRRWQERDRADPASPNYARRYGSPTVLVNGRDVAGMAPSDAPSCRLYTSGRGRRQGVPLLGDLVRALAAPI